MTGYLPHAYNDFRSDWPSQDDRRAEYQACVDRRRRAEEARRRVQEATR